MKKLLLLSTAAAVVMPSAAYAQSAGSVDFETKTITVTGTRTQQVGGIQAPDTTKAKAVLTQEAISRANPGQTILDTINQVPGVNFQNNDAYGSGGGTLTIRGFSADRVSLTFDGIPLNDSGNYAIYSNQQIDPELIEQVNVNLGTTDVDSPTASAVGGTVNYRTITPSKQMGGRVSGSIGDFHFRRLFGLFQTGEFTSFGTRAWVSASTSKNDVPFNNYGKLDKQQYNAKIYQPIGSNGDYISIAGHYNENRNNFFGSVRLRNDLAVPNGFPQSKDARFYDINYPCTVRAPSPGTGTTANNLADCGTEFDRRYNPSNTGNLRIESKFTVRPNLILTVEPSFQYVKANGGGTTDAREYGYDVNTLGSGSGGHGSCKGLPSSTNTATVTCVGGYYGGKPYLNGVDLNGDGDALDTVIVLAPSQTRTRRYGVISGLRWDINRQHSFRLNYTLDHADHRQTGEVGLLNQDGEPQDVFPVNNPVVALGNSTIGSNTIPLQKRDRHSLAILNQVSGEYRGLFMGDRLQVNAGLRLPYFTRKLDQNCFTSSAANSSGGFVECSGGDPALDALIALNNPYVVNPVTGAVSGYAVPQKRTLKYHKILPNVGLIYDITKQLSAFANYAQGISVPSTDALYNDFIFPAGTSQAKPDPETSDSIDTGLRFRSSKIQAQAGLWWTTFKNREAVSFDPEINNSVYRNLGTVKKWGFDGSIAYAPIKAVTLYAFGSVAHSKIQDNIQTGTLPTGLTCDSSTLTLAQQYGSCALTGGKYESGAPKWSYGGTVLGHLGPLEASLTAKRTGPRYIFDNNAPVFATNEATGSATALQVFDNKTPPYWLVNAEARLNMGFISPMMSKTYLQGNVYNLFDKKYVGGFGGNLSQTVKSGGSQFSDPPFVQIGAPRTASVTLSVGF